MDFVAIEKPAAVSTFAVVKPRSFAFGRLFNLKYAPREEGGMCDSAQITALIVRGEGMREAQCASLGASLAASPRAQHYAAP